MKRSLILIALLMVMPLTTGCGKRKVAKPSMGEVERLPRLETVVLGEPSRLEMIRSYTVTIEAMEEADLNALVRGYLKVRPPDLDIGRLVKKDELLLTLYVPDLVADRDNKKAVVEQMEKAEALALQAIEVARAEVKEAEAVLLRHEAERAFRKTQHTRISKLAEADTLSKQQLDEARLQLSSAEAAVGAAQAQIVTKEQRLQSAHKESQLASARVKAARAELQRAEVQVEFANLRAPFDGVITKRWVDSGATITDAKMPLFRMQRTDKVRVLMDVPEPHVPYLRAGEQGNAVEVHVPSLQEVLGSTRITGRITMLAAALDPVTRTMRAELHLDNKHGVFKPQMTGTAHVTLAVRESLTVPASALVRNGNKMEIFIVADPAGDPPRGPVKRVEVHIGLDDGRRVEIRNDTLTGKELVIAKGAGILRPGDQVIAMSARQSD